MNRRQFLQAVAAVSIAPSITATEAGKLIVWESYPLTHWDTDYIWPDGSVTQPASVTWEQAPPVIVDYVNGTVTRG